MKKAKMFCALVVCLLCFGQAYPNFADYCIQFGKRYSFEESVLREQIYDARVISFANITSYIAAVNSMTDWTQAEIKARKGLQMSNKSEENKYVSSKVGAPQSLDWREKGAVTQVKDQDDCGSCWSFAAAAYAESKLIIQGKYKADQIDLSEQFLLKCTKQSDCNGGFLEDALQAVRVCPKQEKYPYHPTYSNNGICSSDGIRTGYINYNYYDLSDAQMINLLQKGPVAISVLSQGWQSYGSGIFSCSPSQESTDHAVLLVGYTPDYWIIKNQWGKDWGLSGYMNVARASDRNCKIGQSAHILFQHWGLTLGIFLLFLGFYFE